MSLNNSSEIHVDFSFILEEAAKNNTENESIHNLSDNLDINLILLNARSLNGRYFCPFCGIDHAFEFLLMKHLGKNHQDVLNADIAKFVQCIVCQTMLVDHKIATKHVLNQHGDKVLQNITKQDEKYAKCLFCTFYVLKQQQTRILLHLENKHLTECHLKLSQNFTFTPRQLLHKSSDKKLRERNNFSIVTRSSAKKNSNELEFKRLCQFFQQCKIKANQNKENIKSLKPILKSSLKKKNIELNVSRKSATARKSLRFDLPENNTKLSLKKKVAGILNSKKDFKYFTEDDRSKGWSLSRSSTQTANSNQTSFRKLR